MKSTQHIELEIDNLASGGAGVGRLADGRVVFVPGTAPGDCVMVEIDPCSRKSPLWGELQEVLSPGGERVEGPCSVKGCGGCAWQHLQLDAQREWKVRHLNDALRRIGKLPLEPGRVPPIINGRQEWHYRHRARLHGGEVDGRWRFGLYESKSHRLTSFTECLLLPPELNRLAARLIDSLAKRRFKAAYLELAWSAPDDGGGAVIGLDHVLQKAAARSVKSIFDELEDLKCLHVRRPNGPVISYGQEALRYPHRRSRSYELHYTPGVFTQVNPEVNDLLVDQVVAQAAMASQSNVLELFAGVGNLALPLARGGARVMAVENNHGAATFLKKNSEKAGLVQVVQKSTRKVLQQLVQSGYRPELVLSDPPRRGMKAEVPLLLELNPRRIIYISCEPATLARDLAALVKGGYQLELVQAFDMFPQTPHLESMAVLNRGS